MEKTKKVRAIDNGTVIDHITPGKAMRCLRLINPKTDKPLFIGMNVDSGKMGKKDFIKIENYYPTGEEIDKVSLIAPNATINTIEEGEVEGKRRAEVPKEVKGEIKCINPKCVTNNEDYITPRYLAEGVQPLKLRCTYCDEVLTEEDIVRQRFPSKK